MNLTALFFSCANQLISKLRFLIQPKLAFLAIVVSLVCYSSTVKATTLSLDQRSTTTVFSNSTILSNTQGANGRVDKVSVQSLKYTPNSDFCGTDYFSYTIQSSGGLLLSAPSPTPSLNNEESPEEDTEGVEELSNVEIDSQLSRGGVTTTRIIVTANVRCVSTNSKPSISNIANQSLFAGQSKTVSFTVQDGEISASSLNVSVSSSNTSLLPNNLITLGGSGITRSLTIAALQNKKGTSNVTVTVSDGQLTETKTFQVLANTTIHGNIDILSKVGNDYFLGGWACRKGYTNSIQVHLYAGGAAGSSGAIHFATGWANAPSESGVANACNSTSNNHRFSIKIPSWALSDHAGKSILVHGISIANTSNLTINRSGAFYLPVTNATREVRYIHTDLLGSPVAETDEGGNLQ